MKLCVRLFLPFLTCALVEASQLSASLGTEMMLMGKNPIRKVVTLLQDMQKEIQVEMAKEKELFEKFMCFCSSNAGDLATSAAQAKASVEDLSAKLKAEEAESVRIGQELVDHKTDREAAKKDLAEATSLRDKEKSEFDATSADRKANIGALGQAIPTLEKAMAGGASFIQLPHSKLIKNLAEQNQNIDEWDKRALVAFLEHKDGNDSPGSSGQIVGVMKQIKDDMESEDKESDEEEAKNAADFAELKSTKEKEIEFASESIESKTVRKGELAVSVVQTKDSLEDTQEELAQNEKYAEQLKKECGTKEQAAKEQELSRSQEIAAVGEAIKILNDDDALGLVQKVFNNNNDAPQAGALEFLQREHRRASKFQKGQAILAEAALHFPSPTLKLILFTMNSKVKMQGRGKTQKFTEIIKMVDDMVVVLGKEQANDEKHKSFCADEFDKNADEEAAVTDKIGKLDAAIGETEDDIATITDEITTLGQGIKDLDKAVAQATEQRKEEHAEYVEAQTMNEAAIALLRKAKDKLEKVYKPSFAQIDSFVQIKMHSESEDSDDSEDQEPKKSDKAGGVLGMMDMIIHDLESEGKDAQYEEKSAQKDYAALMQESQASRAQDIKSLTDKEGAKAESEVKVENLKSKRATAGTELTGVKEAAHNLHASCDFIVQNFDIRKEARTNEIESLKNAKAILSGADFR